MDGEIIRMYHPLYTTNPLGNLWVAERICVRLIGLEPTRLATPDPKSGASTNFATSAILHAKIAGSGQNAKKNQCFFCMPRSNWYFCISSFLISYLSVYGTFCQV